MAKRCIICEDGATLQIKNTSDFYCKECAKEYFSDLDVLIKLEQDAVNLKKFIEDQK